MVEGSSGFAPRESSAALNDFLIASQNSLAILSCTRTREAAEIRLKRAHGELVRSQLNCLPTQICPQFARNPATLNCREYYRMSFKLGIAYPSSALFKDASPNTIAGDFPPNSSVTRFMLLFKASSCTAFPPAIEPVKLIFEIAM